MKLKSCMIIACLSVSSAKAMEKQAAVIVPQQLPRQLTGVLFLKTSDGKNYSVEADWLSDSEWFKEQLLADPHIGSTATKPLVLPLNDVEFQVFKKWLKLHKRNDTIKLTFQEIGNLDLSNLSNFIRKMNQLKMTYFASLLKDEIIKKFKEPAFLNEFLKNALVLDKLGLPQEAMNSLGSSVLTDEEVNALRSLLFTELNNQGSVYHVDFNTTSDYLLASGEKGNGKGFCDLWDVQTGAKIQSLEAKKPVKESAFCMTPLLVTASEEESTLWDMLKKTAVANIAGQGIVAMPIWGMCLSPHLTLLALGQGENILVKNLKDTNTRTFRSAHEGVDLGQGSHLLFNSDGSVLIEIRSTGIIRFWSVDVGTCITVVEEQKSPITKCCCSRNGILATITASGWLQLWDIAKGKSIVSRDLAELNYGAPLCFNAAGSHAALASNDGGGIFDIEKGIISQKLENPGCKLIDGCYHPDNKMLAALGSNREIYLYAKDGKIMIRLELPACSVPHFSGDGNALAAVYEGGKIRLWHYCNQKMTHYLRNGMNLKQALLVLAILRARKANTALDFLQVAHNKELFALLDQNLLGRFLK